METAIREMVYRFNDLILNPILYFLVAVSIVLFLWGLTQFLLSDGDNKNEGKSRMTWGIIGLFIIFSVWGIIHIIQGTLDNVETYQPVLHESYRHCMNRTKEQGRPISSGGTGECDGLF